MYMVNEVAINWNGALVYALAMFLPEGAWPPPVSEIDAGAGGAHDAGGFDAGPDDAGGRLPTRRGGCGCATASPTASTAWAAWALVAVLVTRARRSRS